MDTSGKPREGWMAIIPATILALFVILALGGPVRFANTVTMWASDVGHVVARWLRSL